LLACRLESRRKRRRDLAAPLSCFLKNNKICALGRSITAKAEREREREREGGRQANGILFIVFHWASPDDPQMSHLISPTGYRVRLLSRGMQRPFHFLVSCFTNVRIKKIRLKKCADRIAADLARHLPPSDPRTLTVSRSYDRPISQNAKEREEKRETKRERERERKNRTVLSLATERKVGV